MGYEIMIYSLFALFIMIFIYFLKQPKVRVLVFNDDGTATIYKKGILEDKEKLGVKAIKKVWLKTNESRPLILKSIFGLSRLYLVNENNPAVLDYKPNGLRTKEINASELASFNDSHIIQDMFSAVNQKANFTLILIAFLAISAIVLGYIIFIAPNVIPKDACMALAHGAKTATNVMKP
jgi:hypothetical protein